MKANKLFQNIKGSKFTQAMGKAGRTTKKHSPLILAVVGGVGVVATAYFAYKAAPRVNEIVEDLENKREIEARYLELNHTPAAQLTDELVEEAIELDKNRDAWEIDRFQVGKDLLGAVALPVCTGIVSLAAIAFSYRIMSGRITALSGVVSALTYEKARQDERLKKELDAETYSRITRPTETVEKEVVDQDGNKKLIKGEAKVTETNLNGAFFSDSDEFVKDDITYNLRWIEESERKLDNRLSLTGFVMLNQVYDALGLERTKEGAIMGWSIGDNFKFGIDQIDCMDRHGDFYTEIYVKWPAPRCIYEDVDYEGRYSITGGY